MQAWYLCENPYPFIPQDVLDSVDSVRGSLPNRYCNPQTAARLYEECLDEYRVCDEMGLNVISNEHHAGINFLYGASPLILGILARETKKIRILSLGTLVTARSDPVRIAEEYATADIISKGRLDIGFVKSGGSEMASANANPIGNLERFWESIDLIKKTLTSHDGPVSWEGKYFTHRHINIWPPCYQRPHPPLWAATGDPETSVELAKRDIINATFVRGPDGTRKSWDAYRQARKDAGMGPAGPDRFAYMGFTYVGDSDDEGMEMGDKSLWFLRVGARSAAQYSRMLPGTTPASQAPLLYRSAPPPSLAGGVPAVGRPAAAFRNVTAEQAVQRGVMFAGNPDTVFRQVMEFYDKVGGFEHLILMGRSGFMTHAEAEKGIRMFGKEVLPRLKEVKHAPVA